MLVWSKSSFYGAYKVIRSVEGYFRKGPEECQIPVAQDKFHESKVQRVGFLSFEVLQDERSL